MKYVFLCLPIGYLFGLLQTSFFYGKLQGIDIREHGSGNAGTTNALRVMGSKAGIIVFAGDLGKMLLAWLAVWLLFVRPHPELRMAAALLTGLGVVLGHDFPFYMDFKGGKGIAVTGGLLLILDWRLALIGGIMFFGITCLTHYVSLASCVMVTVSFICFLVLGEHELLDFGTFPKTAAYLIMLCWALLALIRHKENIVRLVHGKENKLHLRK